MLLYRREDGHFEQQTDHHALPYGGHEQVYIDIVLEKAQAL